MTAGARRMRLRGPDDPVLTAAGAHLRAGGLVAFPTETVYGLGADATQAAACRRIYAVKGRPADNPLIVHFAGLADVEATLGPLGPMGRALAEHVWPGPLTLVVARPEGVLEAAAAGLDTVAVRVPAHPVARALVEAAGRPVAAPSANRSGRPSTTTAESVWQDLAEAAAAGEDVSDVWLLDGGPAPLGVESTVVDVTGDRPRILRWGALSAAEVARWAGPVAAGGEGRRSPGTRHRHYAPRLPLWVFEAGCPSARLAEWIAGRPGTVGVLAPPERLADLLPRLGEAAGRVRARPLGGESDPEGEAAARDLFACLRWLEEVGAQEALAELPADGRGRRAAVRDRLVRAAEGRRLEPEGTT